MTISIRPASERGHANHGWLDSHHTFSFAHYYDAEHMGFRALRVINDDVIAPAAGFATHGHRDMEIVTYVLNGAVSHRDTTGGSGVLARGDVQAMTAGSGIRHSEFNASAVEKLRLLQIWLVPESEGIAPVYAQTQFSDQTKHNQLRLIASGAGEAGSLKIHQDAKVYASVLDQGQSVSLALGAGRGAWIQVAQGSIEVMGKIMGDGDGAAVEDAESITITATDAAEFLVFDLA